ncbi:ABC transporter permease subunit [Butyrivibrio sp. X503]|uniref:sugar ABC transporter permease n=1 Tax=Butyrivibrio sp. X503 TaxID=2364878 RepID=UPI000EAA5BEA|nr:ABC transporter permease subunit [Butyrivibrio sp. X503]MBR4669074.1 ABC transporter permease subunit [Butyrivibrio sp.]RKM56491.1 ABC transporter permease subunit [Butyrivibrio sp. X503]
MKKKRAIENAVTYAVLIIISIIWLFPFVGLVLQSFRSYATEYGGMVNYLVPKSFSLDNYKFLFSGETNYVRWYANTLIIAFFVALFQTIIILCVSYALSRMRFTGRTFLMKFWLILGMFPGFLTMICLYFLLKQFGLTQEGAVPGLILVSIASSGMQYYVCKGFFDTIPKALDEAARIDGASRARIFVSMILPIIKPIIIYTALVAFMAPWCDYVFASYVAFGHDPSYNVAVAMTRWVWTNDYQGYFTRFCAGGVLISVPVTLLFMFLQKYYVEGVTGGAVKG